MALTETIQQQNRHTIERIDTVLQANPDLSEHLDDLEITMEGSQIVLRGQVPSVALKQALVPAIRQAGVLGEVCNCVEIA